VQPQEPATGPVPQPSAAPAPNPAAGGAKDPTHVRLAGSRLRNRRARLIVAMLAGITALLCLGGIGIVVSFYDNFLRAYLVNRDDQDAQLYTCRSGLDLAALSQLRAETIRREKEFSVSVNVGWSTLTVIDAGSGGKLVGADLVISGSANGNTTSRRTESWSFGVVDDDGWRVCSAKKGP
jgi:hypothetical protein